VLGAVEVGGRVAGEVGAAERARVRQREVDVGLLLHPHPQTAAAAVEHVPAGASIGAEEVQVVPGDLHARSVRR
jgi:hypothetical protein